MSGVDSVPFTVVDLASLSMNFPQAPIPELGGDNVVSTVEQLFNATALTVIIEGEEGMGKTTVLSQFVRKHLDRAISIFVSASNRLSSDPDLILQDLFVQTGWLRHWVWRTMQCSAKTNFNFFPR